MTDADYGEEVYVEEGTEAEYVVEVNAQVEAGDIKIKLQYILTKCNIGLIATFGLLALLV